MLLGFCHNCENQMPQQPSTEPTATEPTATEPTATEPTATEPTATEPTATEQILCCEIHIVDLIYQKLLEILASCPQ